MDTVTMSPVEHPSLTAHSVQKYFGGFFLHSSHLMLSGPATDKMVNNLSLLFFPIALIALLATATTNLNCLSWRGLVYAITPWTKAFDHSCHFSSCLFHFFNVLEEWHCTSSVREWRLYSAIKTFSAVLFIPSQIILHAWFAILTHIEQWLILFIYLFDCLFPC